MSLDDISRNSAVVRMEDIGEDQLDHGHMVHDEDRTDPRNKTSQHSRGNGDLSEERGDINKEDQLIADDNVKAHEKEGMLYYQYQNGQMWSGFSFSEKDDDVMRKPEDDNASEIAERKRRRPTEKAAQYKRGLLEEKRNKQHRRLLRKTGAIEDLMYSSKNASAVQDELQLLDGIFNQIIAVTDSKEVFEDAEYKHVEDWFDEIDEKLCTFKRKVHNWLKDAMREMEDKKLSCKGSSHSQRLKSSKSSHRSSRSSRSSTKEKAIAEKIHLAEPLAEASFMEKRRNVEYEAEALQLQEKLEKAKARTKIYEEYDKQSIKDETAADNQNVGKNLNQYYPQKPFEHQSEMFTLDANAKPFHLNKQYNSREKVEGADKKRFSSE